MPVDDLGLGPVDAFVGAFHLGDALAALARHREHLVGGVERVGVGLESALSRCGSAACSAAVTTKPPPME